MSEVFAVVGDDVVVIGPVVAFVAEELLPPDDKLAGQPLHALGGSVLDHLVLDLLQDKSINNKDLGPFWDWCNSDIV